MIWIVLALLGVPLWLRAFALTTMAFRNRMLRTREGDLVVRLAATDGGGWRRGHAVWVHDVFAFRGSPAAWREVLVVVTAVTVRPPTVDEAHPLRKLDEPAIAELTTDTGSIVLVAAPRASIDQVAAPFVGV